jgi:hypothetical protein
MIEHEWTMREHAGKGTRLKENRLAQKGRREITFI